MQSLCRKVALLFALFVAIASLQHVAHAIPDGFEDRAVIESSGIVLMPTDLAFAPTGEMLVVNKGGQLIVFQDPNGDDSYPVHTEALNLAPFLCSNSDRGVLAVEVHPDFETNRYM